MAKKWLDSIEKQKRRGVTDGQTDRVNSIVDNNDS